MNAPRNRFVSQSRARGLHEVDVRRAWLLTVRMLRELAAAQAENRTLDKFERAQLAGLIIKLVPIRFGYPTAEAVVAGFMSIGRACAAADFPAHLVGLLVAFADVLDGFLVETGHELAALSRRRSGDPE